MKNQILNIILAGLLGIAILYVNPIKIPSVLFGICQGFIYGMAILGGHYMLNGMKR